MCMQILTRINTNIRLLIMSLLIILHIDGIQLAHYVLSCLELVNNNKMMMPVSWMNINESSSSVTY